jgi:hypothetical protein
MTVQRVRHNPAAGPPDPGVMMISAHHPAIAGHRCGPDGGLTAAEKVEAFRAYLRDHPAAVAGVRRTWAGKTVACRCRVGQPCIGDVVASVAAGEAP